MIIPIRCFTCNKVLASLYKKYKKLTELEKNTDDDDISGYEITVEKSNVEVFKELGVERYCCRRHLISHVDLIQKI